MSEFFDLYFNFNRIDYNKEVPVNCHRWCGISVVAALLGRRVTFPFGAQSLFPNQYIQIIGLSASRKSTAIKLAKKLLKLYGYTNFSPEKSSLEKFLMDLHDITWEGQGNEDTMTTDDFLSDPFTSKKDKASTLPVAEMLICNDEFVDFIGRNNLDFISLLGTFWDYDDVYDRKLKHSAPVYINRPTINILSGNTPSQFNQAFPTDIQEQGFFSRLLLIHAKATGEKVTIPMPPDEQIVRAITTLMADIQNNCIGEAKLGTGTYELLDHIYKTWEPLTDMRFEYYSNRRFTHLLKLSIILAASRVSTTITREDVIFANTILTFAEYTMPDALGEFGKSKNSSVAHKVLQYITKSTKPLNAVDIFKQVSNDVENIKTLSDILSTLARSDKIIIAKEGILPKSHYKSMEDTDTVKPSLLTIQEREAV